MTTDARGKQRPPPGPDLPAGVQRWADHVLPVLAETCDRDRLMTLAAEMTASDRHNSFDAFRATADLLANRIETAGLRADRHRIPTGGGTGDGRWRINWAADTVSATLDVIDPVQRRLADAADNPWEAIQWSLATPPQGLRLEVRLVDSPEDLRAMKRDSLRGCAVLTRSSLFQDQPGLVRTGAGAVIVDRPVKDYPDATQWTKFGWGGLPTGQAGARLPGMAISAAKGDLLRTWLEKHGRVRVQMTVLTRDYHGHHDVISAVLPGELDPQNEVWAVAHSYEPGAVDNASGVAAGLEALRILRALIDSGSIPPPKRSIRALAGFECYGFFHYLETVKRLRPPLAGLVVDCVGVRPDLCEGRMDWHNTVPSSAGYVNDLGYGLMQQAFREIAPEIELTAKPFASTEDTMLGDPHYGFPCPYLGIYPYPTYHSSADTMDCLDPAALAAACVGTAAYLYWLADAGSSDAVALARWRAGRAGSDRQTGARAQPVQCPNAETEGLKRLLWEGDHRTISRQFEDILSPSHPAPSAPDRTDESDGRVPFRRIPLGPTYENVPADVRETLRGCGVHKWALYWADGQRDLSDIRELASAERGKEVSAAQIAVFFEALDQIGYVVLREPDEVITRDQLCADLRALGITPGMDLMVHSSLSAIGWVRGGADTVVDALLEVVGTHGTLMMPSFNHRAAEVYNPRTTPTTNGAIADAFWRRADTVRSLHPTHAVAALGPKAERWCADHIEVGIWAPESPIGRLIHEGGYLLSLGVDHTTSTAYHVAEISMDAPCLNQFGGPRPVVMPDGTVQPVPGLLWRDGTCPVKPARLNQALDDKGVQTRGMVGEAHCLLVKARDLWETRREHLSGVCPTCPIRPIRGW